MGNKTNNGENYLYLYLNDGKFLFISIMQINILQQFVDHRMIQKSMDTKQFRKKLRKGKFLLMKDTST